jgi:serine/threonine protein kinase
MGGIMIDRERDTTPPPSRAQQPAVVLSGRYELRQQIGRGNVATVYAAFDRKKYMLVAVKILQLRYCRHPDKQEREMHIARFLREVEVAERWSGKHANLITVLNSGVDPAGPYFVMEHLQGSDLYQLLKKQTFSLEAILYYLMRICQAVAVAHSLGVIHRDLKPSNIFVRQGTGDIVLLDFGIAFPMDGRPRLTPLRTHIGTLSISPPEQWRADDPGSHVPDVRDDIWAIGDLMYRMATGHSAFSHDVISVDALKARILYEDPPRIQRDDIPNVYQRIIDRCLQKEPGDRYPDVLSLQGDLNHVIRLVTGLSPAQFVLENLPGFLAPDAT